MALPTTLAELKRIKEECKSMVTKRASLSAAAAIVPIPGTDIAADIGLLIEMLPAINRRFGLSPEQIDELDPDTKKYIFVIATSVGSELIGKYITKELIIQVLKRVGIRLASKQVVKYIPILGQVTAAILSFGVMKYVGNSHVDDCYNVVKRVLEDGAGQA